MRWLCYCLFAALLAVILGGCRSAPLPATTSSATLMPTRVLPTPTATPTATPTPLPTATLYGNQHSAVCDSGQRWTLSGDRARCLY